MSEEKSYRADANNKILPLEDVRLKLHFPHILDSTWLDSWGNPSDVARVAPMQFSAREFKFAVLFKNAPELLHILLELKKICSMDDKGAALFNRFDEIVKEIENAYKDYHRE